MATEKIILVIRIDVDPEKEEEFNRWYDQEHIPALLKVPGVLSAQRGRLREGDAPPYVAIYEHADENVRQSQAYQQAVNTPWTQELRPYFRTFEALIYGAISAKQNNTDRIRL